MPLGGTLRFESANVPASPDGYDRPRIDGDSVRLTVADTGVGMTSDVLARAVEPFYTTKEVGKGTGLGLSMVYGFMKQTGGGVRIEGIGGCALIRDKCCAGAEALDDEAREPIGGAVEDADGIEVGPREELGSAVERCGEECGQAGGFGARHARECRCWSPARQ